MSSDRALEAPFCICDIVSVAAFVKTSTAYEVSDMCDRLVRAFNYTTFYAGYHLEELLEYPVLSSLPE